MEVGQDFRLGFLLKASLPGVARNCSQQFLDRSVSVFSARCNFTSLQPVRIPSLEMKNAPPKGVAFFMARELGFEPRTDRLHIILIFRIGVDYIIIPLGCEALRQLSLLLADSL